MSKPLESQTKTKVFPTIGNDFIVNADNNKKEKKTSTSILVFFLLLRLFEQLWRRVYSDKRTKTRFLVGTRHIIVAAIKARKNRRRTEFGAEMQILSADDEKKCVDLFYVAVFFYIFWRLDEPDDLSRESNAKHPSNLAGVKHLDRKIVNLNLERWARKEKGYQNMYEKCSF